MAHMIADSSALILLAKCSLLEIVCGLFEVIVPQAVNTEVASEDLVKNYPDAALISELTAKGAIKIQRIDKDEPYPAHIASQGRKRCLAIGYKAGIDHCLQQMTARPSRQQGSLMFRLSSLLRSSLNCLDYRKYHSRRHVNPSKSSARSEDIHLRSLLMRWSR